MLDEQLLSDIETYLNENYLPDKGIGWFVPPALTEQSKTTYTRPGEIESDMQIEGKPNEYSTLVSTKFDEQSKGQIKEKVCGYLEERGLSDEDLSAASGVSEDVIAQLKEKDDYRPSKNAVLALSVGLHLSVAQAEELLALEGHDLRKGSRFDLIITYCLNHEFYDVETINQLMQRYGEAHLGA